jgi:hypothetical protein
MQTVSSLCTCISRVHIWNNSKNVVSKECQLQNQPYRFENIEFSDLCICVNNSFCIQKNCVQYAVPKQELLHGLHEMSLSELPVF